MASVRYFGTAGSGIRSSSGTKATKGKASGSVSEAIAKYSPTGSATRSLGSSTVTEIRGGETKVIKPEEKPPTNASYSVYDPTTGDIRYLSSSGYQIYLREQEIKQKKERELQIQREAEQRRLLLQQQQNRGTIEELNKNLPEKPNLLGGLYTFKTPFTKKTEVLTAREIEQMKREGKIQELKDLGLGIFADVPPAKGSIYEVSSYEKGKTGEQYNTVYTSPLSDVYNPKIEKTVEQKPAETTKGNDFIIKPAKQSAVQKLAISSTDEAGTVKGIASGVALTTYYAGKGFIKGLTAPIRPKFYTEEIPGMLKLLTSPFRGETNPEVGEYLYQNPQEVIGEFAGFPEGFKIGKGLIIKGGQSIIKATSPNYLAPDNLGIKIQEGVTIPTKLKDLFKFQNKEVPAVHSTLSSELKIGSEITPAPTENLAGWRRAVNQRNFYTSSPVEAEITKILPSGEEIPVSYRGTPIQTRFKPVLYGGYIGIGEAYSGGSTEVISLFPKSAKGFIFRETPIRETPANIKTKSLPEIVKYQSETPGTYVPAENIKGVSIEGQFTTSAGAEGSPIYRIEENPSGALKGKFTYYNVKEPFPIKNAPSGVIKVWDLLTSRNQKIKFYEAEFKEISPSEATPSKGVNIEEYSGSYGSTYKPVSELVKPFPSSSVRSSTSFFGRGVSSSSFYTESEPVSESFSSSLSSPSSTIKVSESASISTSSSDIVRPVYSYNLTSSSSRSRISSPISSVSSSSMSKSTSSSVKSVVSSPSVSSSVSSSSGRVSPSVTSTPPPVYSFSRSSASKRKSEDLFKVLVRKRGKFKSLTSKGVTLKEAFKRGRIAVESTASASFKIIPLSTGGFKRISAEASSSLPSNIFRKSKKEENVFIQKRRYRISSPGEKFEIPGKAKVLRKIKGGF